MGPENYYNYNFNTAFDSVYSMNTSFSTNYIDWKLTASDNAASLMAANPGKYTLGNYVQDDVATSASSLKAFAAQVELVGESVQKLKESMAGVSDLVEKLDYNWREDEPAGFAIIGTHGLLSEQIMSGILEAVGDVWESDEPLYTQWMRYLTITTPEKRWALKGEYTDDQWACPLYKEHSNVLSLDDADKNVIPVLYWPEFDA
jgi:hypothetical protein